jgi:putative transposase
VVSQDLLGEILQLGFKAILKPPDFPDGEGVACVKIPPRSPNCNPHAERFVRSIKFECLRHFVFFGERHLRYVINEYMSHYHEERFHQGIGGQLIRPASAEDNALTGEASCCVGSEIKCRSRLGGLLNFYYREAA